LTGHSTTIATQGVRLWQYPTTVGWDSSPRAQAWIQVRTSVEVCRPGEIVWTAASQAAIESGSSADAPAWQAAIVERIATRTVEVYAVMMDAAEW
jgi:hypothetical protein